MANATRHAPRILPVQWISCQDVVGVTARSAKASRVQELTEEVEQAFLQASISGLVALTQDPLKHLNLKICFVPTSMSWSIASLAGLRCRTRRKELPLQENRFAVRPWTSFLLRRLPMKFAVICPRCCTVPPASSGNG